MLGLPRAAAMGSDTNSLTRIPVAYKSSIKQVLRNRSVGLRPTTRAAASKPSTSPIFSVFGSRLSFPGPAI